MFHVIARSIERQLLFRTWAEARVMWDTVVGASPGLMSTFGWPRLFPDSCGGGTTGAGRRARSS